MTERSFAPAVLTGLAGAVLNAVAGGQDWATATGSAAGVAVRASAKGSAAAPLVLALALVALAAWGVVLVGRGAARRVVAVVGLVVSLGALAATVAGTGAARHDAVAAAVAKGATAGAATQLTGWYVAALVGALLAAVGFAVAVLRAPSWPAMGSRYDAPGTRPVEERDLWRAIDEGHDPTE